MKTLAAVNKTNIRAASKAMATKLFHMPAFLEVKHNQTKMQGFYRESKLFPMSSKTPIQ